ncbi:hypothetical protein GCM10027162_39230 [Streptomyces incanus]
MFPLPTRRHTGCDPPHRPLRALVSAACAAALGAGLLAGAGTSTSAATPAQEAAAGSKVIGYFTE